MDKSITETQLEPTDNQKVYGRMAVSLASSLMMQGGSIYKVVTEPSTNLTGKLVAFAQNGLYPSLGKVDGEYPLEPGMLGLSTVSENGDDLIPLIIIFPPKTEPGSLTRIESKLGRNTQISDRQRRFVTYEVDPTKLDKLFHFVYFADRLSSGKASEILFSDENLLASPELTRLKKALHK